MSTFPPLPDQFPVPNAPPVVRAESNLLRPVPVWPKVIGIISICWGGLGLMCGGIGLLQSIVGTTFQPRIPGSIQFQQPPISALLIGSGALSFVLAALLVVAGIVLVQRKPVGAKLHLVYGVASIPAAVLGMAAGFEYTESMFAQMDQVAIGNPRPGAAPQQMMPMGRVFGVVGLVIGAIIQLVYPVFCLWWFGVQQRRGAELALSNRGQPPQPYRELP